MTAIGALETCKLNNGERMMSIGRGIAVWDVPIRVFHWLVVILIAMAWISAEQGVMDWHRRIGLAVLFLVTFRVLWGFLGSNTARFSGFVRSPSAVLAYVRGKAHGAAGHNPLGGYSVLALLALMAAQVTTGLFAVDVDGLESGYLAHLVSFEAGRQAAEIHEASFALLQVLIAFHILAILFYRFARGRNLVRPMITGRDAELADAQGALEGAPAWRLVLALVLAGLLAWWISAGA